MATLMSAYGQATTSAFGHYRVAGTELLKKKPLPGKGRGLSPNAYLYAC